MFYIGSRENEKMTQAELDFNFPPNPYRPGTGNFRVYEWLRENGRITLHELHHVLWVDTARIRIDVKPYLRQHGLDIECQRIRQGETEYRVV